MEKNKTQPRRKRETSTFAENLKKILKQRGISQRIAAQMAGVSNSTMNDWLSGSAPNDLHKVSNLAKALNVSFESLCLGTHDGRPIDQIPIEEIFEEVPTDFEGVYKITAKRLVRKKTLKG